VLNLPLIGIWIRLLKVPYRLLFPAIMVFTAIGIYSINNSFFEIYLMAFFGILGFVWIKLDCNPVPLILGLVLGPMIEENLRRSMLLSNGNPMIFLTRPISLAFIIVSVLLLIVMVMPAVRKRRGNIAG
jgi:putative tricarboxylic transport membrane protein